MRQEKAIRIAIEASYAMGDESYRLSLLRHMLMVMPDESGDWAGEIRDAYMILRPDERRLAKEYRVRRGRLAADMFESQALEAIIKAEERKTKNGKGNESKKSQNRKRN